MYTQNTTCHSSIESIREAASIKLAKYATERWSVRMTTERRETIEPETQFTRGEIKVREQLYLPHTKTYSHNYETIVTHNPWKKHRQI